MSKYNSLVKKFEAFEKVAKFGSRADFLQSLGQDGQSVADKLGPAVSTLYNNILNWIKNSAERQTDVPGRPEAGLPVGVRQPVQVILSTMKNNTYDLNTLPALKQAIKNLLNVSNLGNLGGNASNAWMKSVFPQASYVQDLINSQFSFLTAYHNNTQFTNETPKETPVEIATAPISATNPTKVKKLNQSAKAVAKALVNKINRLSDGPERVNQLKEVEVGIKTLQNYFKRLQNSNAITDYLARTDIINALNKAYNVLDYKDLETVVSLAPGRQGIPSDPNAKI